MKKKVILIVGGVILIILFAITASFFFDFSPESLLFDVVGPPPTEHRARQQWLSENIDNMDHNKFVKINEKLPSWSELEQLNQELANKKNYPQFIKAIQTYGTLPNLVEVLYFGDVLQDLGVNTQFVHANYWFKNGEFKLWYFDYQKPRELNQDEAKRALLHNILLAKKQGLAVILFPDYFQLENGGMKKLGIDDDLESRLEVIALELAEIAEKYGVEYLVPSNQIEMLFESNGYQIKEAQERSNAFYAKVVPKIKEVYSGKIMYKMGGFGSWDNYDGISLEGADLFGFTGCYHRRYDEIDFVVDDLKRAAAKAGQLSQKYAVPWMNAEFVISDDESNDDRQPVAKMQPIEDYYQAGLSAFNQYGKNAVGFTIHSLLGSGKVYNTSAMPLIKEFFKSKE